MEKMLQDFERKRNHKPCYAPAKTGQSYKDVSSLIGRTLSFKYGYSKYACQYRVSAYYEQISEGLAIYYVYSYCTLMLAVRIEEIDGRFVNTVMYFDNGYYSQTTSKLQRIIRCNYDIPIKMINVGKRKEIFKEYKGCYYNYGEYWR